jgi:hypothetical protein
MYQSIFDRAYSRNYICNCESSQLTGLDHAYDNNELNEIGFNTISRLDCGSSTTLCCPLFLGSHYMSRHDLFNTGVRSRHHQMKLGKNESTGIVFPTFPDQELIVPPSNLGLF